MPLTSCCRLTSLFSLRTTVLSLFCAPEGERTAVSPYRRAKPLAIAQDRFASDNTGHGADQATTHGLPWSDARHVVPRIHSGATNRHLTFLHGPTILRARLRHREPSGAWRMMAPTRIRLGIPPAFGRLGPREHERSPASRVAPLQGGLKDWPGCRSFSTRRVLAVFGRTGTTALCACGPELDAKFGKYLAATDRDERKNLATEIQRDNPGEPLLRPCFATVS